jgi:transmembrane sensor
MTKADNNAPELDPLQREAVGWVQRLVSGHATSEDVEELKLWRNRSAAHAAAFAEASRAWNDVGPAGRSLRSRGGELALLAPVRRPAVSRRLVLGGGLAAAAAFAYGMVRPPLDLWPSLSELNADYRTATGEQRSVTLAETVSVRMNTQTSIALQSSGGEGERIRLIAGEASFATAPGARRSLSVLAGDGTASTREAQFDVRHMARTEATVCVTCFDGSVRIEHPAGQIALGPGQQIRYDAKALSRVVDVDRESASDWQRGIVVFRSTPLLDVVEEINRYRPGRIILLSEALGRKPVNGRFRVDQMDEILLRLEQAFNAKVQTLPGGVVLLS